MLIWSERGAATTWGVASKYVEREPAEIVSDSVNFDSVMHNEQEKGIVELKIFADFAEM